MVIPPALATAASKKVSAALLASSYNADGTVLIDRKPEQGGHKPAGYFNSTLQGVNGDKGRMRFTLAQMLNLTTSGAIDDKYNQLVTTYGEPALLAAGQTYWDRGTQVLHVEYHSDYDVLQAFLDKKIIFDAQGNVDNSVVNPEYVAWKNFPVGTRISAYECRWNTYSNQKACTTRTLGYAGSSMPRPVTTSSLKVKGWPIQRDYWRDLPAEGAHVYRYGKSQG